MSTKSKFANTFLDIETEDKPEDKPVEMTPTKQEIIITNNTLINKELSLNKLIQSKLGALEQLISMENSKSFKKSKEQAKKFSDKYTGVTISLRREIQEIVDILTEESVLNKYEIIETIMINGIKNTNFD